MCVRVCVYSEETLTKQLENTAADIEKHRKMINKLSNENTSLKNEEENIDRKIRSKCLHRKSYYVVFNCCFVYY